LYHGRMSVDGAFVGGRSPLELELEVEPRREAAR
jgi:hypothetical protein